MYYKKTFLVWSFIAFGLWGIKISAEGSQKKHNSSEMNHIQKDDSKRSHNKTDHSNKSHSMNNNSKGDVSKLKKENRKALAPAVKKSIVSVLEANSVLHKAFFNYSGKSVEENAVQLKKAIEAIEDKEISKLLNFSKSKLSEIKAENNREINNKNYHLISMALIHIINKYDLESNYNAYYCPMEKKKWIQNSKKMAKVHNPYSPKMPHCGSQESHY